jgi:hypothetical protein
MENMNFTLEKKKCPKKEIIYTIQVDDQFVQPSSPCTPPKLDRVLDGQSSSPVPPYSGANSYHAFVSQDQCPSSPQSSALNTTLPLLLHSSSPVMCTQPNLWKTIGNTPPQHKKSPCVLCKLFYDRLKDGVKDLLLTLPDITSLYNYQKQAIKCDIRLFKCSKEWKLGQASVHPPTTTLTTPSSSPPDVDKMVNNYGQALLLHNGVREWMGPRGKTGDKKKQMNGNEW